MMDLTEEELVLNYPCQFNHIQRAKHHVSIADEDICSHGGKMYETYGEELAFVQEMATKNRVLTIIEADEDETNDDGEETSVWYVISGFHYVNRIGYLITEQSIGDDQFEVKLDY
jgi:hypothetical protein